MNGYIKLYRKMLDWEWMDNPITVSVFVYCLLRANYETTRWHGIVIEPGQFVTSYSSMSKALGISVKNLRTALDHLKSARQVARKPAGSATLVTVVNWAEYQSAGEKVARLPARLPAGDRQGTGTEVATDKEYKEIKEIKKERSIRESFDDGFLQEAHSRFAPIKAMLAAEGSARAKEAE